MIDWVQATGFDWDDGNIRKNQKNGLSMAETEQVFFNAPLLVLADSKHSGRDVPYQSLIKVWLQEKLHER